MGAWVEIEIAKDKITNEGPYQFIVRLRNDMGEVVEMPQVKFGCLNDSLYVYAIQNGKNKTDSKFMKQINRKLYKVGMGYIGNDDSDENLKDITASFLYVLSIAIAYFKNLGIDNIIVPSILIERWNNKKIANRMKMKREKLVEYLGNKGVYCYDINSNVGECEDVDVECDVVVAFTSAKRKSASQLASERIKRKRNRVKLRMQRLRRKNKVKSAKRRKAAKRAAKTRKRLYGHS